MHDFCVNAIPGRNGETTLVCRSLWNSSMISTRKRLCAMSPLVRCSIFNASVRAGVITALWKSANVIPVAKTTPALNVDSDFRPISLTPIVSKVLESFIYKWLLQSILNKIDPLQFISLKGSSTTMALLYLFQKWLEATDKGETSLRICLLDFSKAVWSHCRITISCKTNCYKWGFIPSI